jgi:predicted HTH domain antitoxin
MHDLMQITVELPDDITRHPDPGREALEALAIEGYRSEKLTHHQAAQLLGLSRFEFDGFLKSREIYDHAYSVVDLDRDLATLQKLEEKGLLRRP